jgi:hypothetical protein
LLKFAAKPTEIVSRQAAPETKAAPAASGKHNVS